ncbi:3'-5' exonuclease [Citrobacter portucalensis]
MTVTLDTESTGLDPQTNALLEIAIVDDDGHPLVNTLLNPGPAFTSWDQAQAVHGISPAMVAGAPSLADVAGLITAAVHDQDVVIYNANFDAGFLGELLDGARSVICCMEAWAKHNGEWSDYHNGWRWVPLNQAAADVLFQWPDKAHRALADALGCRAVWQYLTVPAERERVDGAREALKLERKAAQLLAAQLREEKYAVEKRQEAITRFLAVWWLDAYGARSHWSVTLAAKDATEAFAQIFYGRSTVLLALEDRVTTVYTRRKDIPAHLHAASFFSKENWYLAELQPAAAYIGAKTGWLLYAATEEDRIRDKYPLRFMQASDDAETVVLPRSALRNCGVSDKEIDQLQPVAERMNRFSFSWYVVYRYPRLALPHPEKEKIATGQQPADVAGIDDAIRKMAEATKP